MAAFHMKTTASVFALRALSVSAAIGVASMPGIADAGHGSVADHGSHGLIHLYVDIPDNWDSHYGAGADNQFGRLQDHFEAASRILWDATEGHLGIGTVTFYKGFGSADINVRVGESGKAPCLRAETGVLGGIGGLGVIAFCPQNLKPGPQVPDGIVIAHELGHYVLGLGDEYKDNARSGGGVCPEQGYYGSCLDGKTDDRSNCIMESDTTATEFCSRANHDPDQYNKEMCVLSGNPKVPYVSTTTHQSAVNFIEIAFGSSGTHKYGLSCWETMSRDFPLIPPLETISSDGLPWASPPGGYVPVSFVDLRRYPDSIVLVLDRSGSMNAHPDDDRGEVCKNGKDDDKDGVTDEGDCSEPRIAYLRAAARAFLQLIAEDERLRTMYDPNHPGLRVALTSFARTASTDFELDMLSGNLEKIQDVISALSPSGQTAIGDAIEQAHKQLENEVGDRAMVLISDGQQNSGADPLVTAARLGQEGIAIHTISLGAASDTPTLAEIAKLTRGESSAKRNSHSLIASFAALRAQMNNDVLIIPEQRYHTNAPWMDPEADPKDEVPKDHDIPDDAWFSGDDGLDRTPVGAEINRVEFPVADGTAQVTVLLAGDLPDMSRFSIDAVLIDPNRKYYGLDHPLADSVVVRDDYFEMLRINEPAPGRWTLEIYTAMGRQAEQTGAFTIYASTKPSAARHTLEVRAVPRLASTTDTVRVSILPTYQYALRDLEALGLQVIDPVGAGWSVAVEANPKGGYMAEISGLAYKGVHTLQVLARSGPDTNHDPGRALGGGAHSIPSFLVGQTAAFFVTDGIDVSPPRLDDRSFD